MPTKITLLQDDITRLHVDAIVNAANNSLSTGCGVNGAIQRAAGPELLNACRHLQGCETGDAKITPGFNLPAKYVIHTVGPVWQGGEKGEPELLASCYRQTLKLAEQHQLRSIAFPAISCGVYGYPIKQACDLAVATVIEESSKYPHLRKVIFCAFDDDVHRFLLAALGQSQVH